VLSPLAALLDFSATLHQAAPDALPTPAKALRFINRSLSSSSPIDSPTHLGTPFAAMANVLSVPPVHVEHVAEAVVRSIEQEGVEGPIDVAGIRKLVGWENGKKDDKEEPYQDTA
jgi:hypothetical protein